MKKFLYTQSETLEDWLDALLEAFQDVTDGEDIAPLMDEYCRLLTDIRNTDSVNWRQIIHDVLRPHPLRELMHADPFEERCFSKPRGYAGDAVILDMIYSSHESNIAIPEDIEFRDRLAQNLYRYSCTTQECRAVYNRKLLLTQKLDELPADGRALSIACGHFREAEASKIVQSGNFERIVGLDFDGQSLKVAAQNLGKYGVETLKASVQDLMSGQLAFADFDLVYTAGLYDYLEDSVAQIATKTMFDMLRPGGKCLTANFMPGCPDVGVMEAYMDWWLIYRTEEDMATLAALVDPKQIASLKTWVDDTGLIVYLEIEKLVA